MSPIQIDNEFIYFIYHTIRNSSHPEKFRSELSRPGINRQKICTEKVQNQRPVNRHMAISKMTTTISVVSVDTTPPATRLTAHIFFCSIAVLSLLVKYRDTLVHFLLYMLNTNLLILRALRRGWERWNILSQVGQQEQNSFIGPWIQH